jgi:cellulose synthase operon protein C
MVVKAGVAGPLVEATISQWKAKYPDLLRSDLARLLDDGDAALASDTTASYAEAAEKFQKALVLEPSNDRAVSGWILALAFGAPQALDEPMAKAAEALLADAEQRGSNVRVFVAHAHLLLARGGNPNDVRVLAERGTSSPMASDRALGALAVGQTQVVKNPLVAAQSFREALATDPKLKRAYLFQARQAALTGNYKEATQAFERRLELDPDQWEAAHELARLLVDVGETTKARKGLEASRAAFPAAIPPRLLLAMLSYQHLGDLNSANTELSAMAAMADLKPQEKADILLHLGTVQRLAGDFDRALETLERSLEASPHAVAPTLQKVIAFLDKGVASSARLEFDDLKGRLGDKQLEATLEGRLLLAEGRFDEAIATLSVVADADPRRVDAIFLGGAAAAKAKKPGKAWDFCLHRGLKADPFFRPVQSLTGVFVRPVDVLKPAIGVYAALANPNEDPSPSLCEGMVAWFSENLAAADRHFQKAIAVDAKNADAFAYRSFIATQRKDVGGGLRLGARAIECARANPLSWLSQARAQGAANKADQAKLSAQQSLKFGPHLLGARVLVGEGEAAQKNPTEARRLLTSVLLIDPLYRDAKRVLYKRQL